LRIYGIKACDTCRKAAKTLGVALHDIRADPLPAAQLAAFEAAFGEALINRRSPTWRSLSEADQALPAPEMIAKHPTVMKRPVFERDGKLTLGWTKDVQAQYGV
jgi:arsenate reductase-like glutaredoxin family protein